MPPLAPPPPFELSDEDSLDGVLRLPLEPTIMEEIPSMIPDIQMNIDIIASKVPFKPSHTLKVAQPQAKKS